MKHTLEARLAAGLVALGWVEDKGERSRYRAFTKESTKTPGQWVRVFIGPSGALRSGPCASRSRSLACPGSPTPFYEKLLQAGERALTPGSEYQE